MGADADRRLLLNHILQEYKRTGGRINVPRGCTYNDPTVLDQLDVRLLLRALSSDDALLDLNQCLASPSTSATSLLKRMGAANPFASPTPDLPHGVSGGGSAAANPFMSEGGDSSGRGDPANPFEKRSRNTSDAGNPFHTSGKASKELGRSQGGRSTGEPPAKATAVHLSYAPGTATSTNTDTATNPATGPAAPLALDLPVLDAGLGEDQVRDLAYQLFASCCPGGPGTSSASATSSTATLLVAMRGQLELDEARAKDMESVLRHVATGSWSAPRRCSLEGLATCLALARPHDFSPLAGSSRSFKAYVRWRDGTLAVIRAAADRWPCPSSCAPARPALLARLKGSLRRLAVSEAGELEEGEMREAAAAVMDALRSLVFQGMHGSGASISPRASNGTVPPSPSPHSHPQPHTFPSPPSHAHWQQGGPTFYPPSSQPNNHLPSDPGVGWATFDTPAQPSHLPPPAPAFDTGWGDATGLGGGGGGLQGGGGWGGPGLGAASGAAPLSWRLPFALRARVAEQLLGALFDSLEPASYIDEASGVQLVLEGSVWPALGISPALALSLNAWVHFRQYMVTKDARIARQLKALITKLAALVKAMQPRPAGHAGSQAGEGEPGEGDVAAAVAGMMVQHAQTLLQDYHANYPQGKEQQLQTMLDITSAACSARGDSDADVLRLLCQLTAASISAASTRALGSRQRDAGDAGSRGGARLPVEQQVLAQLGAANDVWAVEQRVYDKLMRGVMPGHAALVAAQLHGTAGEPLMAWLRAGPGLDPPAVTVFHTALALNAALAAVVEPAQQEASCQASPYLSHPATTAPFHPSPGTPGLYPPLPAAGQNGQAAGAGGAGRGGGAEGAGLQSVHGVVAAALRGFRRWELDIPLQQALSRWSSSRAERLGTWVERALQQEAWSGVEGAQGGCAQSAVDVMAAVHDALEGLWGMRLPLPPAPLGLLLQGCEAALVKYGQAIVNHVGLPSRFIPPMPALTRYKKDEVVKQERVEAALTAAANASLSGSRVKKAKGLAALLDMPSLAALTSSTKALEGCFMDSVPKVESSRDLALVNTKLNNKVLQCCAASAHYVHTRISNIREAVALRWQDKGTGPAPGEAGRLDLSFSQADQVLQAAVMATCASLATKVVFWDQRSAWLEQVYRHRVPSAAAGQGAGEAPFAISWDTLLEATHTVLGEVCSCLPPAVRQVFALQLLNACCSAYERVLLDGGPCRWFTPADTRSLQRDLDQLAALFEAEGEGVSSDDVATALARPRRLLLLLALEPAPLLELLKEARVRGSASLHQGAGRPAVVFEEATVLRVVAHRPDRLGSKYLKEKYKLSKRLKS